MGWHFKKERKLIYWNEKIPISTVAFNPDRPGRTAARSAKSSSVQMARTGEDYVCLPGSMYLAG